MNAGFRLPGDTHRLTVVGKTGSGKSQGAMWHLSQKNFNKVPWIIIDYKKDDNDIINQMNRFVHLDDLKTVPKKPGVYVVHPLPDDTEAVEELLWKIWKNEDTGLLIDEGYMVGDSPALRALLTQGRSKHIPMITLSQRPVWMSRFVFSEADFIQVFYLNDERDRKTVKSFMPKEADTRLPDYHSYYYDVGRDDLKIMAPVPSQEIILETFDNRLKMCKKLI